MHLLCSQHQEQTSTILDQYSREVGDVPISQKRKLRSALPRGTLRPKGTGVDPAIALLTPVPTTGWGPRTKPFLVPRLAALCSQRSLFASLLGPLCDPGAREDEKTGANLEPTFGSAFFWQDWNWLDEQPVG